MGLTDFFKISFKKPELSQDELLKEEKKDRIKNAVKSCNARLNSIITLEENDRTEDAFIISKHFIIDIANLFLTLYDLEGIKEAAQIKERMKDSPNPDLANKLIENDEVFELLSRDSVDDKEHRGLTDFFNEYFNSLEIEASKIKKNELQTSHDGHWNKIILQLFVFIIIIICIAYFFANLSPYLERKRFLSKIEKLELIEKDFQQEKFLLDWLVLGKISATEGAQKSFNIDYLQEDGGEMKILPHEGMEHKLADGTILKWEKHHAKKQVVDFRTIWGRDVEDAVAYAFTTIDSPKNQKITLGIGSDDAIKVWLNGELVHQSPNGARPAKVDDEQVNVTLVKGKNAILVKVTQLRGGWKFMMRSIKK